MIRAPNARPRTTVPSSRASRAKSATRTLLAQLEHDLPTDDGVRDPPAHFPAAERRVARFGVEAFGIDLVPGAGVEDGDVGRRALAQGAARQGKDLRRTDGEAANQR